MQSINAQRKNIRDDVKGMQADLRSMRIGQISTSTSIPIAESKIDGNKCAHENRNCAKYPFNGSFWKNNKSINKTTYTTSQTP